MIFLKLTLLMVETLVEIEKHFMSLLLEFLILRHIKYCCITKKFRLTVKKKILPKDAHTVTNSEDPDKSFLKE